MLVCDNKNGLFIWNEDVFIEDELLYRVFNGIGMIQESTSFPLTIAIIFINMNPAFGNCVVSIIALFIGV